jgi:hypothetical protein
VTDLVLLGDAPKAEAAAETAGVAATQDKFWEIHDLIYANQQDLF